MKTYKNLWQKLCSYENLELAFKKARKNKTLKSYVINFEKELNQNLAMLRSELLLHSYRPNPLINFIIHDPKTRKISKSDFRDRIVHHALCNIIEPIFEKSFIDDSYANRKGKGTLKAVKRFDYFNRKVSKNNTKRSYVLKADIKHYFENVSHQRLLRIIQRKIKDRKVIWLIKTILQNYSSVKSGIGMPLGNLTSQFFANVYLNELDQFVKHQLKAKYYLRYVDDFVIISNDYPRLYDSQRKIGAFLQENLGLDLHPNKTKIQDISRGIGLLGFRVYPNHRLLKYKNIIRMKHKIFFFQKDLAEKTINLEIAASSIQGWFAYAEQANTYNLRKEISMQIENKLDLKLNLIFPTNLHVRNRFST